MKYLFQQKTTTKDKTNTEDNKLIEVPLERWVWGVVYFDNTELHQFEKGKDVGVFHQIGEINWEKVKMFTMYKPDDMNKRIDLLVTPEIQVFHFYRNIRPAYLDHFIKVYVFGYKMRGTSRAVYNFILPDDRILVSSKDNVDLSLFNIT